MRLPTYQDLSKEQDEINNLPLDGSYLITGPPGTGKTVMALYRAEMLHRRADEVRLLMFSRVLSQYTQAAMDQLKISGLVSTYHAWVDNFVRRNCHVPPPKIGQWVYDWPAIMALLQQNPPDGATLPFLLIDEGQDLAQPFYVVARHMARNLTVFADENQRLTDHNSTLDEIRSAASIRPADVHRLSRNYRNTREIAEVADYFRVTDYDGDVLEPTRSGPLPVVVHHDDLQATVEYILRFERNNPSLEIGVLLRTQKQRTRFAHAMQRRTKSVLQVYVGGLGSKAEKMDFDVPGIKLLCYPSAKGLEFDAVFLPELQENSQSIDAPEFRMRFFVLCSRARTSLFFGYSGSGRPAILDALPEMTSGLIEWRT